MKICYAQEMRNADREAMERYGIPGIVLMENAALCCVRELEKDLKTICGKKIAVFAGKGNNGGDGFAIARHLFNRGAQVTVFLTCGTGFSGDAFTNYEILEKIGCTLTDDLDMLEYQLPLFDGVVDAVFGTGLRGEVTGRARGVIDQINRQARYVLSVDIPSGMNADTGEILGACIRADKTVTFAAMKAGMVLFPGCELCGEIVVGDISMPEEILKDMGMEAITRDFVREHFPRRRKNSHKGDYGKLLVIGGSKGMTGAAALASKSALMCGAGMVTLGIAQSLNAIMEEKLTEVMTLPLQDENGSLTEDAYYDIESDMNRMDTVLVGPGLGRSEEITRLVLRIAKEADVPLIIDADGLNALSQDMDILEECSCDMIFTPHEAEFSRLADLDVKYIEKNRLTVASSFAQDYGVTLILKGPHTVVTAPDGKQYINMTGNPGMATAGSGDVLAGICASLVARGTKEHVAAAMAVYIHGLAGDICAQLYGEESVSAGGICGCIPEALKRILD